MFCMWVRTPDEEFAMEGLTDLVSDREGDYLQNLPQTLQNLTFYNRFKQSMQGVTLPESLQSLTFGHYFNQTMQGVTLPESLKSLTFYQDVWNADEYDERRIPFGLTAAADCM